MTYGRRQSDCSGNCSGFTQNRPVHRHWNHSTVKGFQTIESPLQRFGRGVHVSLRYRYAAVTGDPHDTERVNTGLAQTREEGVP